jgi:hypothetical protein
VETLETRLAKQREEFEGAKLDSAEWQQEVHDLKYKVTKLK